MSTVTGRSVFSLLDTAGIRERKLCRRCQLKEIQVTHRLKQMQPSACLSLRI